MDTRRVKRSIQQKVEVDPEPVEDLNLEVEEDPSFKYLQPELLVQIFDWFKAAHKDRKVRNAQLAQLRRVCAHWRNVIDENVFFEPAISDKNITGNYRRLKTMKVKKCAVAWLTTPPKSSTIPTFLDPTWIKEVHFGDWVSKDAFLVMCEHFNSKCNVTSVGISHGFKYCDDDGRVIATNSDEKEILTKFWGKVTKLDLNVPYLDLCIQGWKDDRNLLEILKTAEMPKLKNVKVTGHWKLLISHLPFYFLCRHHSTLESIHLVLEPFHEHVHPRTFLGQGDIQEVENLYRKLPNYITIGQLQKIQVKFFTVEGYAMGRIVNCTWKHLLFEQRKLEELRLRHMSEPYPRDTDIPSPIPFHYLIPVLQNNMSTLTTLELFKIQFNEVVDFKLFQGLDKLETLKLSKNSNGFVTRIVNMNSLPGSLKTLAINGFGISNMQIKQLAKCTQMKNLSSLELVSVRHLTCTEERGIPGEILKDLIGMQNMIFIHLDKFTAMRAHIEFNIKYVAEKMYFAVPGGEGRLVHVRNNWFFYHINTGPLYTTMCKDERKNVSFGCNEKAANVIF